MERQKINDNGASTKLRACLNCAVIKPASYFKQNGCPNCPYLQTNKGKNMSFTTSTSFKGMVGLVDPKTSWVAKWQRVNHFEPGLYAMTVDGVLSEEFIDRIEQEGRTYVSREESFSLN